jgi:hypothetical protein
MKTAICLSIGFVLAVMVVGCRNGPAIAFSLDLQQGPRLQVGFSASPSTNVASRAVSGPP